MDKQIIEKYSLWGLKAVSVLSVLILLLRFSFDDNIYGAAVFIAVLSSILSIFVLAPAAFIFTNSKGLINFGSVLTLLYGLTLIAVLMQTLLAGNDLDTVLNNGWDYVQAFVMLVSAIFAAIYLSFESGTRVSLIERLVLIAIIPVFMITQLIFPYDGIGTFEGWKMESVFPIVFVTILGLIVLLFSNFYHTIVTPLIFALGCWVTDVVNIKRFLFDNESSSDPYDYYVGPKLNGMVFLKVLFSSALLAYCAFMIWRSRRAEDNI